MEKLLPISWFIESPIDFEHKEYILFDYLQTVDSNFHKKILSPHLLHMERLIDELITFNSSYSIIRENFNRNRYIFIENTKLEGEDDEILMEIKDIVDFSLIQIEPRIKLGYKILSKKNQILF